MHHNAEIWHTHLFQSDAINAKAMSRPDLVFDWTCGYYLVLWYLGSNRSVNLKTSCCSINAALDWRALGGAPLQCCKSRARGCNSLKVHPGHHRDKENRTGWKNVSEHSGLIRVKGRHTSIIFFWIAKTRWCSSFAEFGFRTIWAQLVLNPHTVLELSNIDWTFYRYSNQRILKLMV